MVACYYRSPGTPNMISTINSGVCVGSGSAAGVFQCCFPWDQCVPDGLCYANSTSTYYTALCTDQTLEDGVCQSGCDGIYRTDVRYSGADNLWACCDKSDTACSTSTNATLQAEPPQQLLAQTMTIVDFIPTSTGASSAASTAASSPNSSLSPTTSSSSTTTTSGAQSTPQQAAQNSSSALSTGAIAGISVAAAVIALALIAGLIFLFLRRRRRTNSRLKREGGSPLSSSKAQIYGEMPDAAAKVGEKQSAALVEAPGSDVSGGGRYYDDDWRGGYGHGHAGGRRDGGGAPYELNS